MTTDRSTGSTVVGVFEDRRHAEAAVRDLENAGFRDDQIGLARRDGDTAGGGSGGSGDVTTDTGPGSGAATGAVTGTVLGGLLGAAAALLIPGVGPVVAAGILGPIIGSAAAGAGIGALGGGLVGGLVTTGVREEDAQYYGGEFEAGRTLVTVKAGDRAGEAREILGRHGAYGMEGQGAAPARTTQTTTSTTTHAAAGMPNAGRQTNEAGAIRVPEVEERLDVEKREREMGEVRIEKHVETRQETVPVELEREEVRVERREVAERPIAAGENVEAFNEGTIRVPVRGEEAVVSKEAVVTGEVVIDKERTTEREQISDTVRRTRVEVDENVRDADTNRDARR
jgi:uncharacterized protein (TIGR02271 family)